MLKSILNFCSPYWRLMRFDRPIGIYLLLWPTLWGLWLAAQGIPSLPILLIFVAGVVLTRAAGCVINDIADRKIDPFVARTRTRPLAQGQLRVRQALGLFFILLLLGFILVCQLNSLTIALALVAAALLSIYPFCKRVTYLPQFVLGASFAWSVPMAFAAQIGHIPGLAWYVYLLVVLWTAAYDTMYAMADRADDLRIGVKSTAILFAQYDRVIIGALQASLLLGLLGLGRYLHLSVYYFAALGMSAMLVVYQQYLLKDREPNACFKAFLNNNCFGLLIFLGLFFSLLRY